MTRKLDIENWNRKNTFDYFKNFESPFFSITANVDVTEMHRFCKAKKHSFFLTSLYYSTQVCNQIENFCYRLNGEEVICYEKNDLGSTVLFDDQTFGYAYFEMRDDFQKFIEDGHQIIEELKKNNRLDPKDEKQDLIHYSVIPWIAFTSFQHARSIPIKDSIPKIVFGKIFDQENKKMMPISLSVHHALMDGWHVGQYFEKMNQLKF